MKLFFLSLLILNLNCKTYFDEDFNVKLANSFLSNSVPFIANKIQSKLKLPLEINTNASFEKKILFFTVGVSIQKIEIQSIDLNNLKIDLNYVDKNNAILDVIIPKFSLKVFDTIDIFGHHSGNIMVNSDEFKLSFKLKKLENHKFNLDIPTYSYKNLKLDFSQGVISFLNRLFNSKNKLTNFGINILLNTIHQYVNKINLKDLEIFKTNDVKYLLTLGDNLYFQEEDPVKKTAILFLEIELKCLDINSNKLIDYKNKKLKNKIDLNNGFSINSKLMNIILDLIDFDKLLNNEFNKNNQTKKFLELKNLKNAFIKLSIKKNNLFDLNSFKLYNNSIKYDNILTIDIFSDNIQVCKSIVFNNLILKSKKNKKLKLVSKIDNFMEKNCEINLNKDKLTGIINNFISNSNLLKYLNIIKMKLENTLKSLDKYKVEILENNFYFKFKI